MATCCPNKSVTTQSKIISLNRTSLTSSAFVTIMAVSKDKKKYTLTQREVINAKQMSRCNNMAEDIS